MEPWQRAFLIILAGLTLFLQPGPFLNDEVGQMAALTSLAEGSLLVKSDLPDGYGAVREWGGNVVRAPGSPDVPNAGSTMTTIVSLPVLGVLHILEFALGPLGAVGLLAALAVGGGVWAWRGSLMVAGSVAAPLAVGAALMQVAYAPSSSPYLEAAALQIVGVLFHAFASALLYDLLRTRISRASIATALYAFGTPALFWGLNLKYHGVGISLTMVCIWLYQEGHRTKPWRTALAFAVAGLAVWNHIPNGLLVLGSLGLMATPAVLLGLRPLLGRAAAAVLGLGLGLLPEWWDRMAHEALEQPDRFIQISTAAAPPSQVVGQVAEQVAVHNDGGRLRHAFWNDSGGAGDAAWQMIVWPDWQTPHIGMALPMLALLPLSVLAIWAYRRHGARQFGAPLLVWPIIHLVVLLGLFGRGVFLSGGGFDLRHGSTLWPFVAVAVAPVIGMTNLTWASVARSATGLVAFMATVVWVPFAVIRHQTGFSALQHGIIPDMVEPLIYVGLAIALATLVVWLVPRLGPWRRHAVAVAVAWSFLVQALLQLGPARSHEVGVSFPFVAWPVALLEVAVERFLMPLG